MINKQMIKAIESWSTEKKLTDSSKQVLKLLEEQSELLIELLKNKPDRNNVSSEYGDVLVVLTILSKQVDLPLAQNALLASTKDNIKKGVNNDIISASDISHLLFFASNNIMKIYTGIRRLNVAAEKMLEGQNNIESGMNEIMNELELDIGGYYLYLRLLVTESSKAYFGIENMITADNSIKLAYEKIKNRTGETIDGKFVKTKDLAV